MRRHFRLATALLALAASCASFGTSAQTYPAKPLRWVVGYPAGGGTDFLARTTGAQLSQQLGQPVVVDNRPGAGAIIASEYVARAPGDGYTVLSADNGVLVYNSALYKKLNYEPQKDFALLGMMGRSPLVITAAPNTPFTDARALIAALQREPGKYSIATAGVGSPHHLALELFQREAKVSLLHVPYKGGAPALQDLMGGQIPLMMLDLPSGVSAVKAGKVVPLLAMSAERIPQLPNVPTARELGFTNVEAYTWQGLAVPAGTPREVQERLSTELQKTMRDPGVRQKLYDAGWEARPTNAPDMMAYVNAERQKWHALIKSRNISLD
ncbi:Bug family tripartite tricarboxylate transporter substrate binding protein [Comamonas terrae]|uniref:Bug family tripartite tricarboxylate transporter substrate binding protein n=1 Tax=Comamonas terrae TaxID=673548 RepID=A0ABW5UKU3_9BURK|nr:tripartite tricarboxylate transporter substrate binding protein [Comamonas terrae]